MKKRATKRTTNKSKTVRRRNQFIRKKGKKFLNFRRYDPAQLEHIERHLSGSSTIGSHFKPGSFASAEALVNEAHDHLMKKGYNGKRTVIEITYSRPIGHDSVVAIADLPKGTNVTREPRGRNEFMANVVSGVPKPETNRMVIVAGPLKEAEMHGFYTVFPGKNAPPFPATRAQLRGWGFKGKDLEDAIKQNKEHKKFWDKHTFIKD